MLDYWNNYEKILLNQGLTKLRLKKLKCMHSIISKYLNLKTATAQEIEDFIDKLNKNIIRRSDKIAYSGNSKSDLKKAIKQYYKTTQGNNEFYPKKVSWIRTNIPKDEKALEKPVLSKAQVVDLANKFTKLDYKIVTLLLFDSGFRIQELLSVKKQDLTLESFDNNSKCFWIKCNESKTFTRKIPIPLFTNELKLFFNSDYYNNKQENDPLLDISYAYYTDILKHNSLKLFNKKMTCHCLRHSSATYYAKELRGNVPMLAQRYGWSYSAKELQTYVRNSGAYNIETARISFSNKADELEEENQKIKDKMQEMEKHLKKLEKEKALFQSNILIKELEKRLKKLESKK